MKRWMWVTALAAVLLIAARPLQTEFEFDPIKYLTELQQAPAVIFVAIAATFVAGRFGAKGNVQFGFSLGWGFLTGAGVQIANLGMPQDFASWFTLFIYACVMAYVPSQIYETSKDLLTKALTKAIEPEALGRE